ncbi:hypothetical protein Y032_0028g1734 [Ancylostoma ceylanicum]|uniref:Uncharacterized protein n=1 Tax=Ancylostoma ceylanicum TaxID=53326 RepID=A0A016UTS0_9BILA|nr:hypothetical protein Y032_0028g1734 [Ancylostoma ceylanicum]
MQRRRGDDEAIHEGFRVCVCVLTASRPHTDIHLAAHKCHCYLSQFSIEYDDERVKKYATRAKKNIVNGSNVETSNFSPSPRTAASDKRATSQPAGRPPTTDDTTT